MPRARSLAEVHAELADEHRGIMQLAGQIETAPRDELPALLKRLHDRLVDHFAHEQFPGGLYECMGARDPRYHEELKVLVREHCEVLSQARALVEHSRACARPDALRTEVAGLMEALRDHELREHRLVETIKRSAAARA